MQTFFKENPEINQWVDLLIEKLLTVNILSGNDADSEFHEGRLLVEKIAKSFQEIIDLPQEALVDGIKQLVEQKLPDHRVVENFPEFHFSMQKIILAGLQNLESISSIESIHRDFTPHQVTNLRQLKQENTERIPCSKISLSGDLSLAQEVESSFSLRHHLLKSMDAYNSSTFDKVSTSEELNDLIRDTDKESLLDTFSMPVEVAIIEKEDIDLQIEESLPEVSLLDSEPGVSFSEIMLPDLQPEISPMEVPLQEPQLESPLPEVSPEEVSLSDIRQSIFVPEESISDLQQEISLPDDSMSDDSMSDDLPSALPALSSAIAEKAITKPDFMSRDPFRFNKREKGKPSYLENDTLSLSTPEDKANLANINDSFNIAPRESLKKAIPRTWQEAPEGCKGLERALKKVFPNSPISWNKRVEEYSYLAQCESVLVYLANGLNEEVKNMIQKMKNLGYYVVVCQDEDLLFPRRIERALRWRAR